MASVTFNKVVKKFGDVTAVDQLNFAIDDKEFLVLVGPSGCGKTTALRCLAGLEEITSGSIKIGDQVVNDIPPKDRDIAMVFQSYALYPHMTVYDNMAFGLKLRNMSKEEIKRRVNEAAKILDIGMLLKRKPRELSGGQRQRVALGRAIVREPKVFLFDEPLSNLDAKLRVQTRKEITKLHQRLNTTFIYVTHDQVEAMTMGSQIAVINHGVLQQIDTPQNLYSEPANMFVAGFIGSPAMNFFQAKINKSNGKLIIDTGDFNVEIPQEKTAVYSDYINKDIIFGIRPEDIHNPKFPVSGIKAAPVDCKVDLQELMGDEIYIYLMAGKKDLVARVDSRSEFQVGEKVQVVFDMTNFHVFDPKKDPDNPVAVR
ncbi:sn-glycerol-3-phosphate ABC transporter ATP-binding protein UgpC [candidate division KSB1 bacterium]|nr:sn-glycerol-3-phosphate ABC transporter ATP-binding protein UgpC [candidate division KSB1 bacterium]